MSIKIILIEKMKIKALVFGLTALLALLGGDYVYSQANNQRGFTFPRLMVKGDSSGVEYPLNLTKLKVDVSIIGNIATTTMEMTFKNSTNRVLEGELVFPLGEGQNVSRFALDIDGKLREGVVVEKHKGQQVFEAVVRKNIDPGLLERTKGNNFRARVYPIPSNGFKKALISFESELPYSNEGYIYLLPMSFEKVIDDFNVHVEVANQDIVPKVNSNDFETITFNQWHNSYVTDYRKEKYIPNKQIGFFIPFNKTDNKTYVDKGKVDKNNYFYINTFPKKEEREKKLPKKVTVLWDVSSSMKDRDLNAEIKLLQEYVKNLKDVDIEFIPFSNEVEKRKTYKIINGNAEALIKDLEILSYDGGTQLGVIDLTKYICDEFLLFTDGISNFGKNEITLSKIPVIAVSSSQTCEHSYLQYIATATAGIYINLKKIVVDQALGFLLKQNLQFLYAEFDKNEISEVYPSIPTYFTDNFTIAGKLLSKSAVIKLNFGFGNEVVSSQLVTLNSNSSINKNLIERIWAQKFINELNLNPSGNNEEIASIGKKFSIVTSNTSLIVLDRVEDYVQYGITPPEELMNEYNSLIEKQVVSENLENKAHLDEVFKQLRQKEEWWEKEFKYVKPQIIKNSNQQNIFPSRQYSSQTKNITGTKTNMMPLRTLNFARTKNNATTNPVVM